MPGTGDGCSSATELVRFLSALHGGALLSPTVQPLLHEIHVPHHSSDQTSPIATTGYGLGHFTGTVCGHTAYIHPGDNPGCLAVAAWLPDTNLTVVALSNEETTDLDAILVSAALSA